MSAAEPHQTEPTSDEKIDEAVEDSFPASDPPAYSTGITSGAPHDAHDVRPRRHGPVIAIIAVAVVLVLLWSLFG